MKKNNITHSCYEFFPIENIFSDIIKLKDGTFVKILKILPININLKTEFERLAILNSYKNFLSSLTFDIQIIIQSKKENINNHLKNIKENNCNNSLVECYKNYVMSKTNKKFTSKNFYIIISYKPDSLSENITLKKIKEEINKKYIKIKMGLEKVGNEVIDFENNVEDFHNLLCSFINIRLNCEEQICF